MASAKPMKFQLLVKPVTVPKYMQDGEKFVKWDEETPLCTPITLKVDPSGFYLYWTNLNNETDLIDIATIRDTRTGRSARTPRDPKLKQLVNYGAAGECLEDKTLTVVTGPDFVNLNFCSFSCGSVDIAKQWTTDLLKICNNVLQLNSPVISFLKKIHTKITLLTDKNGNLVVKNVVKALTSNKENKKRVEKVLWDVLGKEPLTPATFPFPLFLQFYQNLTQRSEEVSKIFSKFSRKCPQKMSPEEFMEFINKEQRDPRLNEILYPYMTPEKAKELIELHEPLEGNRREGVLSVEGFLRYLISEDNALVSYEKYDLSDDMDQPMCHYFINSSHNTYLTGHQLTGKSSVEMYRQALLAGCRCVELDFWNGRTEEPVIVHGYTLVPDIPAKEVIEAIAESAFKTSDYPVILSFENHCNPKQQAKIAGYCKEFFGDMLVEVQQGYELLPGVPLPPPSLLQRKIIIKNKKKHKHHKKQPQKKPSEEADLPPATPTNTTTITPTTTTTITPTTTTTATLIDSSDSNSNSDEEDDSEQEDKEKSPTDKGTAGRESEAGAEISALVNYVQPVHFYSFEASLARNRSYEMSSFDERQAMTLLKERPVEFVNYNKYQLSRVYPRGTRVDSGNFMPQLFWNAGCQLAALNYQTMDLAMQLNMGIFELNRKCGYLLKPEFMRRKDRQFDPFAESTVDGIIAGCVGVGVISAQFLTSTTTPQKPCSTYIEVEMYGLPTDTIRKKFKTKLVANTLNPIYEEDEFTFKKVVLPELAYLRIVASEDNGRMIGHRVLPVIGLRPGYRHIVLRNESGQPLNLATVFVHISVKDYVPDGLSDFAEALMNPIKYQGELDRRQKQLCVYLEDEDSPTTTPTSSDDYIQQPPTEPLPQTSTTTTTLLDLEKKKSFHSISIKKKSTEDKSIDTDKIITTPPPPPLASYGKEGHKNSVKFYVDPLEVWLAGKQVKEKFATAGRKVEDVRKGGGGAGGVVKRGLVKKVSRIDLGDPEQRKSQENELVEKCVEEIHTHLTKTMTTQKQKQIKLLSTLKEKETNELMKWIYSSRKDEYRRLSKLTRDKNELGRMKREVNNVLVAKGVSEREKIEESYGEIERGLEGEWSKVFGELGEWSKRRPPQFLLTEGAASSSSSVVQLLRFSK